MELFVQRHQAHIIRLADKVATAIDKEDPMNIKQISSGHTKLNLYKVLLLAFEDLLNYIEVHFTKYFWPRSENTRCLCTNIKKGVSRKIGEPTQNILRKKVESELARIVFFPIKQFGNVPEKRVITFPRTYMSLTNSKWDESNNIFTNIFIKSISKINRDLISSDDCGAWNCVQENTSNK